jgi:hypothetical protein
MHCLNSYQSRLAYLMDGDGNKLPRNVGMEVIWGTVRAQKAAHNQLEQVVVGLLQNVAALSKEQVL